MHGHRSFTLSICIPTFNRSSILALTLSSIVEQAEFHIDGRVEVVICDNFSTDHTQNTCMSYVNRFPENIFYYKQPVPLFPDLNIREALQRGRGAYLKLNNDTLVHRKGSIKYMLDLIETYLDSSDACVTPFFSNGLIPKVGNGVCSSLNDFIRVSQGISTYIGAFGMWKHQFESIDNSVDSSVWLRHLGHVSYLFSSVSSGVSFFIDNKVIADIRKPKHHGGYDVCDVFISEYLRLCRAYSLKSPISKATYEAELRRMVLVSIQWRINQHLYPELYSFTFNNMLDVILVSCSANRRLLLEVTIIGFFKYVSTFARMIVARTLKPLIWALFPSVS
jgi:glycosyltransferase involved in cell wall biosynthesis